MNEIIKIEQIQSRIFTIRGMQVMIDNDLAELYQVEIRVLNQAVKRNITRFPENFRFQITQEEYISVLRSQNVILETGRGKHRKYLPYVFTEQGVAMLDKRKKNVTATIYTKKIPKQLQTDIEKHNAQYPEIKLKKLSTAHDRFLIVDSKIVYHFGASLKDAGKKWFAFSKLEINAKDIIEKL